MENIRGAVFSPRNIRIYQKSGYDYIGYGITSRDFHLRLLRTREVLVMDSLAEELEVEARNPHCNLRDSIRKLDTGYYYPLFDW